jgi:predicted anti-sigma-YlaC factor YlaD
MDCEKVRGLLPGYLDGAMPTGTWASTHLSVGRHLETCDVCRHELKAYQSIFMMMSRISRPTPPPDLS